MHKNEEQAALRSTTLTADLTTKLLLAAVVILLAANLFKPVLGLPAAHAQTSDIMIGRRYPPQVSAYPGGAYVLDDGRLTLYEYKPDLNAAKSKTSMTLNRAASVTVGAY